MDSQIKIWDLKVGPALGVRGGDRERQRVGGELGLVPSRVLSPRLSIHFCWSGVLGSIF